MSKRILLTQGKDVMAITQNGSEWRIEPSITFDEWKEAGRKLALTDNTLQWYWGEWWNQGHKKWDRDAEGFLNELPLKRSTLQRYGSICTLVKPSTRIEGLPFKHHLLVAPFHEDPKEQKMWLKRAADNHWPASQLKIAIKEAYPTEIPPLPEGKFNVIYADPPWQYHVGDQHGKEEQETVLGTHYPSMSIKDLCDMTIPSAENAVLFMWATSPLVMSQEAFQVVGSWGFNAKACFVWDKIKHNVGHYNSVRHEFLLICTKGSFLPQDNTLHDSVVSIERTKHSEKPEEFRKIIETMYPDSKKLELFGRKNVDGWKVWGNEINNEF